MKSLEQIQQIAAEIAADVQRMQAGDDPQLDLAALGAHLRAAEQLVAETEHAGLSQLSADEESAAAGLLAYATEKLQRMSKAQVRQLIFEKQRAADRVWLRLIAMISRDRELRILANRPLVDLRPTLSEARAVAARWRELARWTTDQRRAQAELRLRLEASRSAPQPVPAPDRSGFGDMYRLSGL